MCFSYTKRLFFLPVEMEYFCFASPNVIVMLPICVLYYLNIIVARILG